MSRLSCLTTTSPITALAPRRSGQALSCKNAKDKQKERKRQKETENRRRGATAATGKQQRIPAQGNVELLICQPMFGCIKHKRWKNEDSNQRNEHLHSSLAIPDNFDLAELCTNRTQHSEFMKAHQEIAGHLWRSRTLASLKLVAASYGSRQVQGN